MNKQTTKNKHIFPIFIISKNTKILLGVGIGIFHYYVVKIRRVLFVSLSLLLQLNILCEGFNLLLIEIGTNTYLPAIPVLYYDYVVIDVFHS